MTPVRMMSHVPLVQIDTARVEIGGGTLVALPFEDYDELLLGSFTDGRREYGATAPVFFVSEHDVELPEGLVESINESIKEGGPRLVDAETGFDTRLSSLFGHWDRHLADCGRVRDALALAAPASAIPDPRLSLSLVDIPPLAQTQQGDADQELLFLGGHTTYSLSQPELERAVELLDVVDGCRGELRQAIDTLHAAADLSLTAAEQLTLCAIELEALLLPELTTELKQTFARRLAHLLGGEETEAVARAVYAARSDAVHGEAGVDARPGIAQSLLAAAVVALEPLTRDGSTLAGIRERLDAGPPGAATDVPEAVAPPAPRILYPEPRRVPPSSNHWMLLGGVPIGDPEIADDDLVLFAPVIGVELDTLPAELIDAGFPLSWVWPAQLGGMEDPDIRRDWIAQGEGKTVPVACLALATSPERRPLFGGDYGPALVPLRRTADIAVTAMRLAGLAGFHDPDLLGVYARTGGGTRYRRPAVYRQTVIRHHTRLAQPLDDEIVADLAALWPLLLAYEAGRRAPEIDHALSLFRRAHIWLSLSVATRLELLFASLETALGRGAAEPLARLAEIAQGHDAAAFEWYAGHGVQVRNAVAHGEWAPDDDPHAGEVLRHLLALLGEVLPALLMAWRHRKKARPAKTLVAALGDPDAELDWRAASERAQVAGVRRYAGLDTSILLERGRFAVGAGDVADARRWLERAAADGDTRGHFYLGIVARDAGDLDAARAHLTRAYDGGVPAALAELGRVERVAGNTDMAREHLRMAIDEGDDTAIVSLGILERAAGNIDEARDLYRRASDAGDVGATHNLGLLEERVGNLDVARRWFEQAAEGGNVESMGWAGDMAHQAGDAEAARRWWEQAAEHGDVSSAGQLGEAALRADDLVAARSWWERAAAAGSKPAAERLAQLDALTQTGEGGGPAV